VNPITVAILVLAAALVYSSGQLCAVLRSPLKQWLVLNTARLDLFEEKQQARGE
jgi:hypothetical protein